MQKSRIVSVAFALFFAHRLGRSFTADSFLRLLYFKTFRNSELDIELSSQLAMLTKLTHPQVVPNQNWCWPFKFPIANHISSSSDSISWNCQHWIYKYQRFCLFRFFFSSQLWPPSKAQHMGSPATSLFCSWTRNMMTVRQMGGKMADCGVLQPMTTRQMKSGAFVKVSIAQ